MSTITRDMPVADLAALVCQHLADHGIEAVLTGGAVVTIYSENEYQSNDLDFITTSRRSALVKAMSGLGFVLTADRYFAHPDTPLYVEFPAPPLAIRNEPVTTLAEQRRRTGGLKLLTPTQCVYGSACRLLPLGRPPEPPPGRAGRCTTPHRLGAHRALVPC